MSKDQRIEIGFSGTPEQAETIMLILSHALSSRGIENRILSPHRNLSYRDLTKAVKQIVNDGDPQDRDPESVTDALLQNGYQIKTRWVGDGAATLWQWANFFSTIVEAKEYKKDHEGQIEPSYGWKLEIEIFHINLL